MKTTMMTKRREGEGEKEDDETRRRMYSGWKVDVVRRWKRGGNRVQSRG
jgi:hypothetical protein